MADINWNATLAIGFNFAVVFALCVCLAPWSEVLVGIPIEWALVAAAVAGGAALSSQYQAFLRVRGQAVQFAAFSVISALLTMGLSLLLVAVVHWGWRGRSAGYSLAVAASGFFGLFALRRMGYTKGKASMPVTQGLYRISLPLVPHTIAQQITTLSSRFFLDKISGKEAVGLYAIGYTFGSLVSLPLEAFNNAWTPWIFQKLAARDRRCDVQIVRLTYGAFLALFVLWILLTGVLPFVLRIATPVGYHTAGGLISWVTLSFVLQGMYTLLVPLLIDEAKTDALAMITVTVALLSLGLNYAFIHRSGAIGAAYAAAACAAVRFGLVFWYSAKVRPMPWLSAVFPDRTR